VLASAQQEVLVFDPSRSAVVARFPARVSPSVRDSVDECTPIAVGVDWIGLLNLRTAVLSMYDWGGRDLGATRLDARVHANVTYTTIGGAGHYLAIPSDTMVRNLKVTIDPTCDATTTAAR
jgi:hypothetical protein